MVSEDTKKAGLDIHEMNNPAQLLNQLKLNIMSQQGKGRRSAKNKRTGKCKTQFHRTIARLKRWRGKPLEKLNI